MRNLTERNRLSKATELRVDTSHGDSHIRDGGTIICETCHLLATAHQFLQQPKDGLGPTDALIEIVESGIALNMRSET